MTISGSSPGPTSEHLITLCIHGARERLLSELRQPSTVQICLNHEDVLIDPDLGTHQKQLNLQRMLAAAAKAGHADTVESLLELGQHHNVPVRDMLTIRTIGAALFVNSLEVLLKFQAVDPEVFTRPLAVGTSILGAACHGGPRSEPIPRRQYLALLRHLIEEEGFDPNTSYPSRGLDPGHLLHAACWQACLEAVECLLEHGAVIKGSRATRVAARKGRIDVLEALLGHGADLDESVPAKDVDGPAGTGLHAAVAFNQTDAVKWLLQHNADPSICNSDGKSAADLAVDSSDDELKTLLRQD